MDKTQGGGRTIPLPAGPRILSWASVAGKKEGEGPLGASFDLVGTEDSFGEKSWEKAETAMQKKALALALDKAGLAPGGVDCLLAGDLLDQCTGSAFAARDHGIPFLGLYGACSTMAESLALAALLAEGGFVERAAAVTSSHFCSAERQYRTPLEYGGQRTPTAQWTVTGAGCALVGRGDGGPRITHVTIGRVADKGVKDANNMGAAMAPAAADTILSHLAATGRKPSDYDLIVTGDLGELGLELLGALLREAGLEPASLTDCGVLIYDRDRQDVHCGGSGCGCSAAVLCGLLLGGLAEGRWKRLLFCGTGALLSPTSAQQGESIPGVCHAVAIEGGKEKP